MDIVIDSTVPFLCQCGRDIIEVNEVSTISTRSEVSSNLALSLVNIKNDVLFLNQDRLSADCVNDMLAKGEQVSTSYINLVVPYGKDHDSFVESPEVIMKSSASGWACSGWRQAEDTLSCTIISNSSTVKLRRFESIEIEITDIISYCIPGITYIRAKFTNINDMKNMVKTIAIEKRSAALQINRFLPKDNRYVISDKEQVKLQWKTGASTSGVIHPIEYQLDTRISECTDFPAHSMEYTLDARDSFSNITQICPVFVSPPIISIFQTDEDEKSLSWTTLYGNDITLNDISVEAEKDKFEIPNTWNHAVLSVEGYLFHRNRTIFFTKNYPGLMKLRKEELIFFDYSIIRLSWNSTYKLVKLELKNPEAITVMVNGEGFYEYAIVKGEPLFITFVGINQDDTKCEIEL